MFSYLLIKSKVTWKTGLPYLLHICGLSNPVRTCKSMRPRDLSRYHGCKDYWHTRQYLVCIIFKRLELHVHVQCKYICVSQILLHSMVAQYITLRSALNTKPNYNKTSIFQRSKHVSEYFRIILRKCARYSCPHFTSYYKFLNEGKLQLFV